MSPRETRKKNCWEVMKCGREPGGKYEKDFGTCPASRAYSHNGINGGKNAGRACWAVAGTTATGKAVATYVEKYLDCTQCRFYRKVKKEEAERFNSLEAGRKDEAA